MPFSRDRVLRENLLDGPLTFRSAHEMSLSKAEATFPRFDQKNNMLIVTYRMVSIMVGQEKMHQSKKACPFVTRECLKEDCMAWRRGDCSLILPAGCSSPFENKLT